MKNLFRTLPLFFPLALSLICSKDPTLSYLIAWGGSFFVLYWTISGKIKPLPVDLPFAQQFMRPIIFNQIVFAGYTALTSIFFFLNTNGYFFLEYEPARKMPIEYLIRIAECQRYYLLCHIAVALGMTLHMKYAARQRWTMRIRSYSLLFMRTAILFTILTTAVSFSQSLHQLTIKLQAISTMSTLLSFSLSLPEKKRRVLIINAILYFINLYYSMLSGWKGQSLILLLLLGVLLYPYFKRRVIVGGAIIMLLWFMFIPYYGTLVRELSWQEGLSAEEASRYAYTQTKLADSDTLKQTNWDFLIGRFSEIGMFLKYMENVPKHRDYYGFQITSQSIQTFIPRIFWKSKPDVEKLVMERIYENDITSRDVTVSAKPQFVVDAYLSWGWLGVLIACYIYGALASVISRTAERWFGGYLVGSALLYNSLFQIFWTGTCFEFMANTVFWSFVTMWFIFICGLFSRFIIPVRGNK